MIENGVRRGTITVVSGPPGCGKTVAIAEWLASSRWPGPAVWLALDEYDDDEGHFWRHLAAALIQAGISLPETLFASDLDARLVMTSVLAAQQPPALLVMDDLHLLRAPRLAAGIGYLLGHARSGIRLVAGSRADQPPALGRSLLTGEFTGIRAGQLAFTTPEIRMLLRRYGIAAHRVATMRAMKRMEGWAAGLRFAAGALSDTADGSSDPNIVERLINDYITSEAFATQPAAVREFLLRTSVPEQISPELARELTGCSPVSLEDVAQANLFIEPVADGWYRYHTLFRDTLLLKLRDEDPGLVTDLRRRTALWHHRHGRLIDAVRYAKAADDGPLAAWIVVNGLSVGRLFDPNHGQALLDAIGAAAWEPGATAGPSECVFTAALALARRDSRAAAAWLARTDDVLRRTPPEQESRARLAAAVTRFELARRAGDPGTAYEAAGEQEIALNGLPENVRAAHPELAVRAVSSRGEAALWLGDFEEAAKVFTESVAIRMPWSATGEEARRLGGLALAEALRGRLGRAGELAVKALAAESSSQAPGAGGEPPPNILADIALAWLHLERNELAAVRVSLRRVESGLRLRGDQVAAATASLIAARLYLAQGSHCDAVRILARAGQGWTPPAWLERQLTLAEARAEAVAGDPTAAFRALDRLDEASEPDVVTARAFAWLAARDFGAAVRELRRVFEIAAEEPARTSEREMIDALLIDARIHYAGGDHAAGRRSVAGALRIACGNDIRLPFQMEHSWLFPVLRADSGLARDYEALSRSDQDGGAHTASRSRAVAIPESAVVEPLTEREHDVLRCAAQWLSTEEIANELYISVNTVKTHLKSLYRKLAVSRRGEAVRRATQLDLLLPARQRSPMQGDGPADPT